MDLQNCMESIFVIAEKFNANVAYDVPVNNVHKLLSTSNLQLIILEFVFVKKDQIQINVATLPREVFVYMGYLMKTLDIVPFPTIFNLPDVNLATYLRTTKKILIPPKDTPSESLTDICNKLSKKVAPPPKSKPKTTTAPSVTKTFSRKKKRLETSEDLFSSDLGAEIDHVLQATDPGF